jgi:hypothetical protein
MSKVLTHSSTAWSYIQSSTLENLESMVLKDKITTLRWIIRKEKYNFEEQFCVRGKPNAFIQIRQYSYRQYLYISNLHSFDPEVL